MSRFILLLLAVAGVGCGNFNRVTRDYGFFAWPETHRMADGRIVKVIDRPKATDRRRGKMIVTPPLGDVAKHSFVEGANFGGADIGWQEPEMRAGAQSWLNATERAGSEAQPGEQVLRHQWEFRYQPRHP